MQAPSADSMQRFLNPILPGRGPLMLGSVLGKKRTRSPLTVVLLTAMQAVVTLCEGGGNNLCTSFTICRHTVQEIIFFYIKQVCPYL